MTERNQAVLAHARKTFGEAVTGAYEYVGELTLEIRREDVARVCRGLRDDPDFTHEQHIDLCELTTSSISRNRPRDRGEDRASRRFITCCRLRTTIACACAPFSTTRCRWWPRWWTCGMPPTGSSARRSIC